MNTSILCGLFFILGVTIGTITMGLLCIRKQAQEYYTKVFREMMPKINFDSIGEDMDFLITGTKAYGPYTKDSDIDIVMRKEEAAFFLDLLNNLGIEVTHSKTIDPSYHGFYFPFNNHKKIQIIVTENEEQYLAWQMATNDMKQNKPIHDRKERVMTFQKLFKKYLIHG